jgi:quercetin dioxygenase-like cupin family protein
MEDVMTRTILGAGVLAAAGLVLAVAVGAQPAALTRTILQRADLSAPGREAVMARAEFPAKGSTTGRHTHPGEEIGYMLAGTMRLEVEGQAPRNLKAGDVFIIPEETIHNAVSTDTGVVKVLVTYVVEKGKPVTTPAP